MKVSNFGGVVFRSSRFCPYTWSTSFALRFGLERALIWDQTAAGSCQANWEAGSQVNSEQARLSNFDLAKMSHGDNFGYYKMEHFIPYP